MILKPTKADIQAAMNQFVPDIIAPDLKVLFCGINPSLYSAAVQHHFARPGNRFWKTLHAAGFTDRLLSPFEDQSLLEFGYGVTNLVERATARADQLTSTELEAGHAALVAKVQQFRPRCLAVLGVSAYRTAFRQPKATIGRQPERFQNALLWILPNPSGLNAHYQLVDLQRVYQQLEAALIEEHYG